MPTCKVSRKYSNAFLSYIVKTKRFNISRAFDVAGDKKPLFAIRKPPSGPSYSGLWSYSTCLRALCVFFLDSLNFFPYVLVLRALEYPNVFRWICKSYILWKGARGGGGGGGASGTRKSDPPEYLHMHKLMTHTSVAIVPVSKMLSWRTVFSPTTLLWDIGNLTAWSGGGGG